MNTIFGMFNNLLGIKKYIPKSQKEEIKQAITELDKVKNKMLIEVLNKVIESKTLTVELRNALSKLMNDLQKEGLTDQEQKEEELNIINQSKSHDIEFINLENILDMQCNRYNKYTLSNPAQYIIYNKSRDNYVLAIPNQKEKKSKDLVKLINILKEKLLNKETFITPQYYKLYDNNLLSYMHNNIELFDINHLLTILNYKDSRTKKQSVCRHIKYYSIKNNNVNGFYIKEYIERNDIKHLLMNSRKIRMIKLLELIKEPVTYKIPIEIETLKIIYEIFEDCEPHLQYKVDKYYIDLYLKKINIAIECDENNHKHFKKDDEHTREEIIKKILNCKIIRYNPDDDNFNINHVIKNIVNTLIK